VAPWQRLPGTSIVVDCFSQQSRQLSNRSWILTHFHADHYGATPWAAWPAAPRNKWAGQKSRAALGAHEGAGTKVDLLQNTGSARFAPKKLHTLEPRPKPHALAAGGLTKGFRQGTIYCTPITAALLRLKIKVAEAALRPVPLGQEFVVEGGGQAPDPVCRQGRADWARTWRAANQGQLWGLVGRLPSHPSPLARSHATP
jgi:hypothetical protein